MSDDVTRLAKVLAEHHYADDTALLGEVAMQCGCGWKATTTFGAYTLRARHDAHRAEAIAPLIALNRLLGAMQAQYDAIDAHAELVARMEALADEWECPPHYRQGDHGRRHVPNCHGCTKAGQVRAALNDPTEETTP